MEGVSAPMINIHTELRSLRSDKWVTADNKLTPKALDAIQDIEKLFKTGKKKSSIQVLGTNFKENIKIYVEMFPKGKLPSGKPARADEKNLEANFKWFFQTYEYPWETVLRATAKYVDDFQKNNFLYMRTSQYFISKMSPDKTRESELANYCANIESGNDESEDKHFSDNVV